MPHIRNKKKTEREENMPYYEIRSNDKLFSEPSLI